VLLDQKCAKYGYEIAVQIEKNDNLINKALGVLQEQGVYAYFLFLKASSDEAKSKKIIKASWNLLSSGIIESIKSENWDDHNWHEIIREKLLGNLDDLFLAYRLLEQTLIYARYHAKALKEG
jgi:hypothetical protein